MKKGVKATQYVRLVRTEDGSAKTCSSCRQSLPVGDFPKGNGPDGRHYWCKRCHAGCNSRLNAALKLKVYRHYSEGEPACRCCRESAVVFLTVDHVHNDGAVHRKTVGSGTPLYYWLVRNGFPPGFQILCWNCQHAKAIGVVCPHAHSAVTGAA